MIYQYLHLITATGFVFAYFCFVVLGEYLRAKHGSGGSYSGRHNILNLTVLLLGVCIFTACNYYILHSHNILNTIAESKLFYIPTNWLTFFVVLVCVDFLSYISHYIYHRVRFFWAFHAVHHSDKVLDASTILRVSWSASFFSLVSYAILTYIGVDRVVQVGVVQTIFLHQILSHSSLLRGLLPSWVSHFIVTPDMHSVHHLKTHGRYNLSFMLPYWDRLFKTLYVGDKVVSVDYGVQGIDNNTNPIKIHYEPLKVILIDKK